MRHQASQGTPSGPLIPVVAILLFALAGWLGTAGTAAPPAVGHDAPATEFSAARAMDMLARILGDEAPHPTGTPANAAVRDRIVAELEAIGLEPAVRSRFACGGFTCATVDNVIARIPGASADGAVLLSAHYDSVPASPGAGDDGAGVAAILEAARVLLAGPPPDRDIWLLFNDGEELGLVGAEAFAREPEFARIDRVVNLEARGTTGPSLLIETQDGNAAVAALARRALPHPAGSSLEYEIYRTLPNDTDFTVYRREGLAGVNFAWAEGAARYHTPLDDLAHLDARSVQHHGTHVLAMARAFSAADSDPHDNRDAVFVGLPGGAMPGWPAAWNPVLLCIGLAAWLAWGWRLHRGGQARGLRLAAAGLVTIAALAVLLVLALALYALLRQAGAMPAAWTAQGGYLTAVFLALAPAVLLPAGVLVRRVGGAAGFAFVSLLPFAVSAAAAVAWMPGAAHLGLLPLVAGAFTAHLSPDRGAAWAAALAAGVASVLYTPYALGAYGALGHEGLPGAPVLAGMALLPLLPLLLRARGAAPVLAGLSWLALAGFALMALARPAFDGSVPRQVNLAHVDDGDGARVFAVPRAVLPDDFRRDAGFTGERQPMLPWGGSALAGPEGPRITPPVATVEANAVAGERRRLRVRVASPRGARELGLVVPGAVDLQAVRVDGQPLARSRWHVGDADWHRLTVVGPSPEGVTFELELPLGPATLHAFDRSQGIPPALQPVVRARDAIAVPVGAGDTTMATVRVELP